MTLVAANLVQQSEPVFPIRQELLTVLENHPVNGEYHQIVLAADAAMTDCTPGQFFHLRCPSHDGLSPFFRRPMSIYRFSRERGELSFLYKLAGRGTRAIADLRPGEKLDVVGPLGQGFSLKPDMRHALILARGVGLATLAPLAEALATASTRVTAICSARAPDVLMSTDLFRSFGAEVITVTDAEGNSRIADLEPRIARLIGQEGVDRFFTCGSSRLAHLLQRLGAAYGIGGEVALEQQMACGIGACQSCVRPFRRGDEAVNLRVCHEGPVFDLQEVM